VATIRRVNVSTADLRRKKLSVRLQRYAPWLAALVLVAGVVALIVRLAPSKDAPPQVIPKTHPKPPLTQKTVPLSHGAAKVAFGFVTTAVARTDLAAAWKVSGPGIRGGLSYKEWLSGNIPVVPYPVDTRHFAPRMKIDYSYPKEAQLELALQPKAGSKVRPQLFIVQLRRVADAQGKLRWIVENWVPRTPLAIPKSGS
jgi:hypothetical protein